jgi:hypothetical protein
VCYIRLGCKGLPGANTFLAIVVHLSVSKKIKCFECGNLFFYKWKNFFCSHPSDDKKSLIVEAYGFKKI